MQALRLSLVAKLALAIVLLVLLPSSLLMAFLYHRDRNTAIDEELRIIHMQSMDMANEIDAFIVGQRDIARYTTISDELKTFFTKNPPSPAATIEFNDWLNKWAGVSKHISEVFVLDPHGNCIASTDTAFIGKNYALRPYFQKAIRGEHFVSDWTVGVTSKKPGVYLSSPVQIDNGLTGGVMVIKLDPEPIDAIIRRSNSIGLQAFVTNRDGVVLSHYNPEIRFATVDDLSADESARISATRQFADIQQPSLKLATLRQDIADTKPGQTSVSREYFFKGERKIAALTGAKSQPWVIGITVPFSRIEAPGKQKLFALIPVMLLVLLFTAASSFYLFRYVVRPLRDLLQKTRQLSAGDYSVQADTRGGDEVSQLAQTFNSMAVQIRSHTEELEARVTQRTAELETAYQEIKTLSITDALTGCFNRHYMDQQLASEIDRATRYGRDLAIAICDVDHFKRVNDTWGHQAGDRVLAEVSAVLRNTHRGTDWVARFGGEEFLIVFPETTLENAATLVEKLRRGIADLRIVYDEQTLQITASFGLTALQREAGEAPHILLGRADALLYQAKENGRNRVAVGLAGD